MLITRFFILIFIAFCLQSSAIAQQKNFALAIHGGAGYISPKNLSETQQKAYAEALSQALDIGHKILSEGGTSLDAVSQTIIFLENNPLFNAGKGAVMNAKGKHELDASIMEGKSLDAGAVAGVSNIKNPILAARAVMEKSPHVMLSNEGAEIFAQQQQLERVKNQYFNTPEQLANYKLWKNRQKNPPKKGSQSITGFDKFGTVGVVALDQEGNLAAGTSTGGMLGKRFGRIGDSPVIGAGTYADNAGCAVSATGHGEFFIRLAVAHHISSLVKYQQNTIEEAGKEVIHKQLQDLGGSGGVIILNTKGEVAFVFNTPGMFRAYRNAKGEEVVKMFGEE